MIDLPGPRSHSESPAMGKNKLKPYDHTAPGEKVRWRWRWHFSFDLTKIVIVMITFAATAIGGLVLMGDLGVLQLHCQKHEDDVPYNSSARLAVVVKDCSELEGLGEPKPLMHGMSDEELFRRVLTMPKEPAVPCKRVPKIAFMFLTRGPLPLMPLWEKYFHGHEKMLSVYVHALPGYELNVSTTSHFYQRQIPSQNVSWGMITIENAERRLLANALLDYSNEYFVLLSESCIPLVNFTTTHAYLTNTPLSFVDSFDEYKVFTWGRYKNEMKPKIYREQWRKGAAWHELSRALATPIVLDLTYYPLFHKYLFDRFAEEHFVPTLVNIFNPAMNSNRTLTYTDWSRKGRHPATFGRGLITVDFVKSIRNRGGQPCKYNGHNTTLCFLFARKFPHSALEPLLQISSQAMGF